MKVYAYGACVPFQNQPLVREQIHLAHRYRNALTEIEHGRRASVAAAQATHADIGPLTAAVAAAEAEVEEAVGVVRGSRKTARGNIVDQAAHDRVKEARVSLRAARAALREAKVKAKADPILKAAYDEAERVSRDAIRAARASCGVYWGTYLIVEQAAERARKDSVTPPSFVRWRGDGHLAVQLQGGLSVADLLAGKDSRVRIIHEPGRRDRVLYFRVGSEGHEPIFAALRFKMHRELPANGVVKWVHIVVRRVADRERYEVQFVVDTPPVPVAVDRADCAAGAETKVCGIDVGWRLLDNGSLRVASLVDTAGHTEELVLPPELVTKDEHVSSIASIRDRMLDELKVHFTGRGHVGSSLEAVHAWRNPGRFNRVLAAHLGVERVPSDRRSPEVGRYIELRRRGRDHADAVRTVAAELEHEGFGASGVGPSLSTLDVFLIDSFLIQDRHLWRWQENERLAVQHRRREIYRLWSNRLSRSYGRVVLEDFDLRDVSRRALPEDAPETSKERHRRLRNLAAVSALRQTIEVACARRHVEVVVVDPAYTTKDCWTCLGRCEFDAANHLRHTCEHCGAAWDQDENAARNILASAVAAAPSPEALAERKAARRQQFSARQRRMRKITDAAE